MELRGDVQARATCVTNRQIGTVGGGDTCGNEELGISERVIMAFSVTLTSWEAEVGGWRLQASPGKQPGLNSGWVGGARLSSQLYGEHK